MLDDPSMEILFIALDLDILHPCYNDVKCVFPLQEVVESKAEVMWWWQSRLDCMECGDNLDCAATVNYRNKSANS